MPESLSVLIFPFILSYKSCEFHSPSTPKGWEKKNLPSKEEKKDQWQSFSHTDSLIDQAVGHGQKNNRSSETDVSFVPIFFIFASIFDSLKVSLDL